MLRIAGVCTIVVMGLFGTSAASANAQQRNAGPGGTRPASVGSFWPASGPVRTAEGGSTAQPGARQGTQPGKISLLALRDGNTLEATDVEIGNGRVGYTLSTGDKKDVDMGDVDWRKTFTTNRQRGIMLVMHGTPQ